MFRVYKRKIHLHLFRDGAWVYAFSTNAFPTCKSARAHAEKINPNTAFKASFAKD